MPAAEFAASSRQPIVRSQVVARGLSPREAGVAARIARGRQALQGGQLAESERRRLGVFHYETLASVGKLPGTPANGQEQERFHGTHELIGASVPLPLFETAQECKKATS